MKGKIFAFFCSLLLLAASSKGQTIDGVLYTNFNNYYKWRGGAFDSVLLIPQIAASVGRRPGALRYNTTDSSVYSWTGTQWRRVGQSTDTASLSNRIDLRVKYSDTASMLSPYARTNVVNAGLATKVNISDTSSMLSNYLRSNVAAATYATVAQNNAKLNISDTASMLDGRLSGITLNTSSAIHTTPVTFSRVGGAWSGTLSLANQSGFTVFRRASGTGTPSFGTIDSAYFGGAFRSQVRANTNDYRRDIDTIPLAVFNVGSAAAGDTAAFSTSTLAGSFYLDGTDTMFVTSYRVALQGTSASITPEVWFNDSLNVTAGGTRLATGSAITSLTTGTSVTPTTNKIPPANFVFVRFSAVTTKPTYFTLTLFGYRIRKQ